jgi:hypothetical protein
MSAPRRWRTAAVVRLLLHNALRVDEACAADVAGLGQDSEQLGAMSPYLRGHISRFGAYATDDLARQPEAFNPVLKEVDFTAPALAAA